MAFKDVMQDIEGYRDIAGDIAVLKRYGMDHTSERGRVAQLIGLYHPASIALVVSELIEETASTRTIRLVPREGYLPPFQAGQYINVAVEVQGVRTSRPYSISSSPGQRDFYDITVRRTAEGFVSRYLLDELTVGEALTSSAPAGTFHHNPLFHGDDLVFLAGGSGITPFMSMIREATARNLPRRLHLIYGCDSPDDVIFGPELAERSRRHPQFSWDLVVSSPPPGYAGRTGFITAALLREVLGDLGGRMFYLCGPEAMYAFCGRELAALKVPRKRLRVEMYGPPKDVTQQPGWPREVPAGAVFQVSVRGRGTVAAQAAEPLMIALERAGITVPALCRSGECSLCRTRLLSGRVYQPEGVRLRRSDRTSGYIHACMAYPLEDLEILL